MRSANVALGLLTCINLVNYIDRFVVSALVETLKRSELALSDSQLGGLMTAFMLVYMIAAPGFGALSDRGVSRPLLLGTGVAIWSAATLLSAFANGYGLLFAARALVGIGEAAYATVAPSLIADLYPRERRARVLAVFYSAIPIGSALGYVLGGLVDRAWGWRAAFLIAALPGLILSVAALRMADPPRGAFDGGPAERLAVGGAYGRLFRNVPYVLTVAGGAAYTFAVGAMAFWMPAFLERVRGLPRAEATVQFGAIVVVTGFVGTFGGGWLSDWLLRRWRQAYLGLAGIATLAAVPLAVIAIVAADRALWLTALVVAQLLVFVSTGPFNSVILSVVSPAERATAMALSIFAIHAFGDVPSPWLVGRISDATSLIHGTLLVPVALLVSGLVWIWAALRPERATSLPEGLDLAPPPDPAR